MDNLMQTREAPMPEPDTPLAGIATPPRRSAASVRDWPGIDLCEKIPGLRRTLKWRPLQFWLIWPNFLLFTLFLIAGLFGSPVGSRNMIVVYVWILWWFMLITVLVPFLSRVWCTVCPLPALGEWAQRLRLTGVWPGTGPKKHRTRLFGLNREWPKAFQNIWLQNIGFLCLATISALLVTRPIVSVTVLGSMIVLAVIFSLIFRQRNFCMYLCPVSGFLGLYSMTATIGVRVKDPGICKAHKDKECVLGCASGYGCPWFQYVGNMVRNNYCGMCFECFKTCPYDNPTLYLRPFCSDTTLRDHAEAFKSFIMMVLAMVYSVTLLGPWGTVKDWANVSEVGNWSGFALYALSVFGLSLVVFPAAHLGAVSLGRRLGAEPAVKLKDLFIRYAYAWVPLGLFAWIAFSVPLIAVNGAYIFSALSDPLGRGWDLFGTAHVPWHPVHPDWVGWVQVPLLLVGLYYAFSRTWRIGQTVYADRQRTLRSLLPLWGLAVAAAAGFICLFVG